jgi:acetate kinase
MKSRFKKNEVSASLNCRCTVKHPHSKVRLSVVPTDEELMIARHALSLIAGRMSAAV